MQTNRKQFIFPLKILYIPLLWHGPFIAKNSPVWFPRQRILDMVRSALLHPQKPCAKKRTSSYLNSPVKSVEPSQRWAHVKPTESEPPSPSASTNTDFYFPLILFLTGTASTGILPLAQSGPQHRAGAEGSLRAARRMQSRRTWWKVTRGEVTAEMKPRERWGESERGRGRFQAEATRSHGDLCTALLFYRSNVMRWILSPPWKWRSEDRGRIGTKQWH